MKKLILGTAVVLLVIIAFVWLYLRAPAKDMPAPGTSVVGVAVYRCDDDRTISAIYYEGPEAPRDQGDRPVPAGSVELALDSAASTTLAQTLSGSGVRYANEDESFVFWNKGDEAIVMRDNQMDQAYRNCVADAAR